MDIATLKHLRSVVPGTLILLGGIPIYTFFEKTALPTLQDLDALVAGLGLVLAYAIGSLYNVYGFRSTFNQNSHARISANIKNRLLEMGRTLPLAAARREELLNGDELIDIFYALIDSQDSLKERGQIVRVNGLVWSSVADLVVLGVIFASFYIPLWFTVEYPLFKFWGIASLIVALVAGFILHPQAERRHLELSNEQLNFIRTQMSAEVQSKVNVL